MAPGQGLRGGLPAAWQAGRRFGESHSALLLHGVSLAHLRPVDQWPVGSIGLTGEKSSSIRRWRGMGAKVPGTGTRETRGYCARRPPSGSSGICWGFCTEVYGRLAPTRLGKGPVGGESVVCLPAGRRAASGGPDRQAPPLARQPDQRQECLPSPPMRIPSQCRKGRGIIGVILRYGDTIR